MAKQETEAADSNGYVSLIRRMQSECAMETWTGASLLEALDVLLSYLDRAASCFGGCRGGDHRAEYLTGRVASSCQACLLLISCGYYDESLSIIRSLGEIANLMSMFVTDRAQFERWKAVDESTRRREFTPVKVRLWLESKNGALVIDEQRYRSLSSYSLHASPNAVPQAYNEHGTTMIAPRFQAAGFLLCLNELARSMAFIGIFSGSLLELPKTIKDAIQPVCQMLVDNIGGIDIKTEGRPWFSLS
jgi:hypothetical protein